MMKTKIIFFALLLPLLCLSQSNGHNYIKKTYYNNADTTVVNAKTIEITYHDGLGRAIQQVQASKSGSGKDILTSIDYDDYGRQKMEYLPFSSGGTSMQYVDLSTATTTAGQYYGSAYGDSNPFSEKDFEHSPLNRVLKIAAPGNDWMMGAGHEIKLEYEINSSQDLVKNFLAAAGSITSGYHSIALSQQGYYATGQLYKTITKNENWTTLSGKANTIEEYKNKQGQLVLKRAYGESIVNSVQQFVAHDTYYVYDKYGNLSFVIPPLADGTTADLDGLCYQYKYDYRNRLVEKKLPGKEWEFMVYDKLDRLIAKGPSYSPFGDENLGWLIMKYDKFNRVAYTGWYSGYQATSAGRQSFQQQVNLATAFSETRTASNSIDNISAGYTSGVFPTSGYKLLAINYYDNYTFANPADVVSSVLGVNTLTDAKGLPTGSWVRVLTGPNETSGNLSIMLYDSKSRMIRLHEKNYLGGYTINDSKIDFSGKVTQTVTEHEKSNTGSPTIIKEDFAYTNQDRLLSHTHQINPNSGRAPELLKSNEYDELGNLVIKSVGGNDLSGANAFQKVNYSYNIRGWLTGINDGWPQRSDPADLFVFGIKYDNPESATPLYNGNISETSWQTSSDMVKRKYSYSYDALNRLRDASYQKFEQNYQVTQAYDETIEYDKNGNIKHLKRNGNNDGTFGIEIDNLVYDYNPQKPNELSKVTDGSLDRNNGFADGLNSGNDYSYDAYGNMKSDLNKNLTEIRYNHLNLPTSIVFGTGPNNISYLYDANGKKLKKTVTVDNPAVAGGVAVKTMHYLSGFHYDGDVLKFFPTAEGYVTYTSGQYNYVYNYTDHLGNVRVSYAEDPAARKLKIMEENHYYPFGLKHTNYNVDRYSFQKIDSGLALKAAPSGPSIVFNYDYKYNGKEFQDELGLNLYDYGARNYDPAIGRWMNIDPLAEISRKFSPYAYALDNPVYFIDPDGMSSTSGGPYTQSEQLRDTNTYDPKTKTYNSELVVLSTTSGTEKLSPWEAFIFATTDVPDLSQISKSVSMATTTKSATFRDSRGKAVKSAKDAKKLILNTTTVTQTVNIENNKLPTNANITTVSSTTEIEVGKDGTINFDVADTIITENSNSTVEVGKVTSEFLNEIVEKIKTNEENVHKNDDNYDKNARQFIDELKKE